MKKSSLVKILLSIFLLFLAIFIYSQFSKKKVVINDSTYSENINTNSNIIKDVSYISKDASGNEYNLFASEGQVDIVDNKNIFLTNVKSIINLNDGTKVEIKSDFGKYNIDNFDTIFSKNVLIKYLDNSIKGEYLDFSLNRSTMMISRDVVYKNLENVMKADVIEMNINTRDVKIFMYEEDKKVKIQNKN